jgi:hypothetical protein
LDLYPTYHPAGCVQVLEEAWNLLSDDAKAILQSAESNLNVARIYCDGQYFYWAARFVFENKRWN